MRFARDSGGPRRLCLEFDGSRPRVDSQELFHSFFQNDVSRGGGAERPLTIADVAALFLLRQSPIPMFWYENPVRIANMMCHNTEVSTVALEVGYWWGGGVGLE